MGTNDEFGAIFGDFTSYKTLYEYEPLPNGIDETRILGSEICLWAEVNDNFSLDRYLWMRASFAAKKMWSNEKKNYKEFLLDMIKL